jgi:hypothetical protein
MRCRFCDKEIEGDGIKANLDDEVDDMHLFCDRICLDDYRRYLDDVDNASSYVDDYLY